MIWSPQQEQALARVGTWLRERDKPYFTLAGYAGTGKSTLARELTASVSGPVYYASYTGKAAHVLRKMGISQASTIHKLIYEPHDKCDASLRALLAERAAAPSSTPKEKRALATLDKKIAVERANLRRPDFSLNTDSPLWDAALVVVDEYSMVDEGLGRDLLSFGCPVLALGDPGQLPPVEGRCFFKGEPDYLLTEVHRQAWDNPIIRLSKDVREGKRLVPGAYGSSRVVQETSLGDQELMALYLGCDQLLVGMNATRTGCNRHYRQIHKREGALPVAGDKLVCLRNNHDLGLLNGQIWLVNQVTQGKYLSLVLEEEAGAGKLTCLAHREPFLGRGDELGPQDRRTANAFDYGYALTVHKAQGSQWPHVLVLDEWRGEDRQKWLYTAITRASLGVTVLC